MQKVLAIGRLPGAESPANLLIANEPAMALAPGKCAPGTGPGSTPGNFSDACRFSWPTFQTSNQKLTGVMRGVNPWQNTLRIFLQKHF